MKYRDFKALSQDEMKVLKGGYIEPGGGGTHCSSGPCSYYESGTGNVTGTCETNSNDRCVCKGPNSSIITSSCDGA